jgi:ABC-2 type transport system ATP-binding protein
MIKTGETISIEVLELGKEHIEEIKKLNHVYKVEYNENKLNIKCSGGKHNLIHILDYMQKNQIPFGRIYSELPTLNDVFLEITGKELRD